VSDRHPIWLGLEVCAVILAIAVGLAASGWIIKRREAKRGEPAKLLRIASWVVGALPFVVPIAAFATGGAPGGARDTLPTEAQAKSTATGLTGALDAPG